MHFIEQGKGLADAMHRMKSIDFWNLIGDMTPAEIQLLAAICDEDENNHKVSDLYDACGLQPATVSRLMNGLEERGLIVRSIRKDNRRMTDVVATKQGKELNSRNIEILHSYWEKVLNRMPAKDIDTMLRIYNEMMDGMEQVLSEEMALKNTGKV